MPLPLMLLPLLAAGVGVGGRLGLEFMAGDEEAERASSMLGALRSARTAVPGSEVGETGPELPEYRTDWGRVGEALLEAGDPAGLSLAMSAASAGASAEAEAAKYERDMAKTRYLEEEKWKRQTRELNAKRENEERARQAGFMPQYHAPGSEGHADILSQGTGLKYASSILRDFSESLSRYGTESWGERSGELSSKREQLMLFLKEGEKTGAIDAGTVELFERMLPDPTRLTPDALNTEMGKLKALIDLFNSKYIPEYQARSMYTSNVPVIGAIVSEEMVPAGLVPVDEGQMMREAELQEALDREQRMLRGSDIDYGRQRTLEGELDELTEKARQGQLYQRR